MILIYILHLKSDIGRQFVKLKLDLFGFGEHVIYPASVKCLKNYFYSNKLLIVK